jgi:glycosyltransferase involved in cell wall biosynthesis
MTGRPTISVLITYYNERELLHACLESLAQQSDPPDEVLIYDDASDAPAVEYIPTGMAARVVRGAANRGPAFGRNALLEQSRCDYVHFHDADDLFAPRWCSIVRQTLTASPDVVFTEVQSFDTDGVVTERVLGLERLVQGEDLVRFCIRGAMLTPSGTYRRDLVQAIGGYRTDLAQSEDWEFHIRLAARRPRYVALSSNLVLQRLRPDGRHQRSVEVWTSCVAAVRTLADQLPAEYRHDLADAAARAGSTLFKLNARAEASAAFALAERLGPPRFSGRGPVYRLLAHVVGLERAEEIASTYRRAVPEPVRAYVLHHHG